MEYPFKDLLPLDEVLAREGYYKDWTHLDPEVFYSLTQISNFIKTKGYGVDVRLLIAQLAEHFGLKTTQVVDLGNLLQGKFDNLEGVTQSFTNNINSLVAQMEADKNAVIANATVDSEVILARGGKDTLGQRLDETTTRLAQVVTEVSEITDPYNGYRFAGHRGCTLAPENTKASIELSKKIGFNILETDLKLTSDKEWVVFHDDTVDRITNGTGNIETLTLSQIKALTITKGTNNTDVYTTEKILTLDEMIDLINKLDMYLMLEIKSIATTPDYQKVLDALKRKNVLKKTMIISFNVDVIESFYHLDPNLKLGWLQNGDITQYMIDTVKSWLGENCGLSSNVYNLTETGASLARNNGVPIIAWNILNYDDIDKAFELGCSYVVADDISEEMYNEYNLL